MKERVALVAGASKGIGESIAYALADQGIEHIILLARDRAKLEQVAEHIGVQYKSKADVFVADLAPNNNDTLAQTLASLVQHIDRTYGKLDVVVYNAGAFKLARPLTSAVVKGDTDALLKSIRTMCDDVDMVTNINLAAMEKLTLVLDPLQRAAQDPKAVFISSEASLRVRGGNSIYGPSKAGLTRLSLDVFLASGGAITTYRVFPGNTETEGNTGRKVLYINREELAQQTATLLSSAHTDLYGVPLPTGSFYATAAIDFNTFRKRLHANDRSLSVDLQAAVDRVRVEFQNALRQSATQDTD
jgi:NAD(P)-dependent dehydrogenase (short-subunit alcohol dehydrogenase family)